MKHLLTLALVVGFTNAPAPPPTPLQEPAQLWYDCKSLIVDRLIASNEALTMKGTSP